MPPVDLHRAIDAVWRIESARIIAGLARIVRDVGLAEDLAQDALVAALEYWPQSGIPDKPAAWLMAAAKNRALDQHRRHKLLARKHAELGHELELQHEIRQAQAEAGLDAAIDDDIGDDLLRLIFTACHPVLATEARVSVTLRLLGGLTTEEIARAFLVPAPTVAQRIVRVKRTLAEARVTFEVPRAGRHFGGAAPAVGAGPHTLGSVAHSSRTCRTRARRCARRRTRPLRAAGRDCRLSRTRTCCRRDRLGTRRGALRCAGATRPIPCRGTQSGGRARHGVWPCRGTRACRFAGRGAFARELPLAAQRTRRPPRQTRPIRLDTSGIRDEPPLTNFAIRLGGFCRRVPGRTV